MTRGRRENRSGDASPDERDVTGAAPRDDQARAIREHIRTMMLKIRALKGNTSADADTAGKRPAQDDAEGGGS
jgi:hypothetical protein